MQKQQEKTLIPVRGVLYLTPGQHLYSDGINNYPFKTQKNSLLVRVNVFSATSRDWATNQPELHWKFPRYMPYDFFKNKKEGDYIKIPVGNVKIVLHLVQTLVHGHNVGTFQEVINGFERSSRSNSK